MDNLREIVDVMERRAPGAPVSDTRGWTRERLVRHIESLAPAPPAPKVSRFKKRRGRMKKNLGVGKYCHELLAVVVGRDDQGNDWGLSYEKMMELAQKRFPDSAVDEKHLRWYAAQARRDGKTIPVYRERSRWTK